MYKNPSVRYPIERKIQQNQQQQQETTTQRRKTTTRTQQRHTTQQGFLTKTPFVRTSKQRLREFALLFTLFFFKSIHLKISIERLSGTFLACFLKSFSTMAGFSRCSRCCFVLSAVLGCTFSFSFFPTATLIITLSRFFSLSFLMCTTN